MVNGTYSSDTMVRPGCLQVPHQGGKSKYLSLVFLKDYRLAHSLVQIYVGNTVKGEEIMGLTFLFKKNLTDILPGAFICINIIKHSKNMINIDFHDTI